jgi:hypothetical protein
VLAAVVAAGVAVFSDSLAGVLVSLPLFSVAMLQSCSAMFLRSWIVCPGKEVTMSKCEWKRELVMILQSWGL